MNNSTRLSYDMPHSPYLSGIQGQASHISALQERISELEEALKREKHRADLCQAQLESALAAAAQQAQAAQAAAQALAEALSPAASGAVSAQGTTSFAFDDDCGQVPSHPEAAAAGGIDSAATTCSPLRKDSSAPAQLATGPWTASSLSAISGGAGVGPTGGGEGPQEFEFAVHQSPSAPGQPTRLSPLQALAAAAAAAGCSPPGRAVHHLHGHPNAQARAQGSDPRASASHADTEDADTGSDGGVSGLPRCASCKRPNMGPVAAVLHLSHGLSSSSAVNSGGSGGVSSASLSAGGGGGAEQLVTITKREYELLLLKDKAMDVLQEGITIADATLPDMPLIYANGGFVRTTGYSSSYVVGKNCRFLQGEGTDDGNVRELKQAIREGRSCVVQLLNYKKNGDPFVNYLSLTPIHDTATGKLTHYVGVQSDITELVNHKKAELAAKHAALQAAVATEAKSQFLARMSHEIRTPLNGMIAVGQLLADTSLTPAQWDLVNTIRCSGETLLTLITDILDFSRIEANKMVLHNAVFKLDTVIEAAMEIAGLRAAQRRLQVAYHIAEHMPRILHGDAQRLQQILLNIVNNGIKFTEEGELLLEVWPEGVFPPNSMSTALAAAAAPAAAAASALAAAASAADGPAPAGVTGSVEGTHGGVVLPPPRSAASAHDGAGQAATAQATTAAASGSAQGSGASTAAAGPESEWPIMVLRFCVRDTGIGIAPADLGRLFNSFTQVDASPTRRYGGSGLGLAISRKLCEAMGGQMWAESEGLGRGSSFSWTIICRLPQQAGAKRRTRRSSLVCVTRPPGVGGPGSANGWLLTADSAPGSTAGPGSIGGMGGGLASPRGPSGSPGRPEALPDLHQRPPSMSMAASGTSYDEVDASVAAAAASPFVDNGRGTGLQRTLSIANGTPEGGQSGGASTTATSAASSLQRHSATGGFGGGGAGSSSAAPRLAGSAQDGAAPSPYAAQSFGALASALTGGADPTASLPLLRGKKVLLVEPCEMVRQVIQSALRSWGCRVCAVVSPTDAIARLVACGTLDELQAPKPTKPTPPCKPCMTLQHTSAGALDPELYDIPGPYDCVILDMKATSLLRALTRADDREAQRLVFLGWPGQNEPESDEDDEEEAGLRERVLSEGGAGEPWLNGREGGASSSGPASSGDEPAAPPPRRSHAGGSAAAAAEGGAMAPPYDAYGEPLPSDVTARPPRAVAEEMAKPQNRQLGYVTVTRPVRQGRLKLALEEVLMMALDGGGGRDQGYWSDEAGEEAGGAGLAALGGRSSRSIDLLPVQGSGDVDTPQFCRRSGSTPQRSVLDPFQPQPASAQAQAQPQQQAPPHAGPGQPPASGQPSASTSTPPGLEQALRHPRGGDSSSPSSSATTLELAPWLTAAALHSAPGPVPREPVDSPMRRGAFDDVSSTGSSNPYHPSSVHLHHHQGSTGASSGFSHGHSLGHSHGHSLGHSHGHSGGGHSLVSSLRPASAVKKSGSSTELPDLVLQASGGRRGPLGDPWVGRVPRVLLAEDNAINMKVALGILKRTLPNAEVATAENGVQALEAISAVGGVDSFDVVLMDLHMPVMGGMEAVAEIEARYPNRRCRVVAVTADAFEDTRDSCLAAGFDGWLSKPFRVEDLVRVVGEHLGAARSGAGAGTQHGHAMSSRQPHRR